MDELEHKLRSALTGMADEVAPSHHAWAENQRRISRRRSRRPFLMAAVAAAVVALIAVPVMVLQLRTDTVQSADVPPEPSTPPQTTSLSPPSSNLPYRAEGVYRPQPNEKVLTEPVTVLSDSPDVRTMAYTTQRDGKQFLCTAQADGQRQEVVIDGPSHSICTAMSPPRSGKYVWTSRMVAGISGNGQMVYVASAPTDHILVRRTDGGYGKAYQVAQGPGFMVFNVYVGANPPSAYTARDQANVTLENG